MKAKLRQENNYTYYENKHLNKIFEEMCQYYSVKPEDKRNFYKKCQNDNSFIKSYLTELEVIQKVQQGIQMIKNYLNIDEIIENNGFNPDLSKAIQTPKNSAHNILTFPDLYIENLQKLANK